jgi:hypothetical protein
MKKELINCTTFDELLDNKYGKNGTIKRNIFEQKSRDFIETELSVITDTTSQLTLKKMSSENKNAKSARGNSSKG